jgi:uracil phosphoribosyltransferase
MTVILPESIGLMREALLIDPMPVIGGSMAVSVDMLLPKAATRG